MGKSDALAKANNSTLCASPGCQGLDLPVAPDFVSLPPLADKRKAIEISEFYVHKLCQRPELRELRAEDHCDIEFDLQHPQKIRPRYPAELIDEVLGEVLQN